MVSVGERFSESSGTMRGLSGTSLSSSVLFSSEFRNRSMSSSDEIMCGVRKRNSSFVVVVRVVLPKK